MTGAQASCLHERNANHRSGTLCVEGNLERGSHEVLKQARMPALQSKKLCHSTM